MPLACGVPVELLTKVSSSACYCTVCIVMSSMGCGCGQVETHSDPEVDLPCFCEMLEDDHEMTRIWKETAVSSFQVVV